MRVLDYIQYETVRQGANDLEAVGMVDAYKYVCGLRQIEVPHLKTIAHINKLITGSTGYYRIVPATFAAGLPAIDASLIPRAMTRWADWAVELGFDAPELTVNLLMREFLDIHPFADGNGRTASLLYNFFLGTLTDPEPLPYYYGEPHERG